MRAAAAKPAAARRDSTRRRRNSKPTLADTTANSDAEEIRKVKASFRTLDKNQDGGLDLKEICSLLKRLNTGFSQHQVQQLFCELDVNRNGKIDMNEFVDFLFTGQRNATDVEEEPPTSTPSHEGVRENWKRATLEAHNCRRRLHGSRPLAWSEECYMNAKKQANACQAGNSLFHGNVTGASGRHGQNCFFGSLPGTSAEEVVESWYNEIDDPGYDFNEPGFKSGIGHFTQVVWAGTTHVGMATSDCGTFTVANYYPAGNMMGGFEENVRPANDIDEPGAHQIRVSRSPGQRSPHQRGPNSGEGRRGSGHLSAQSESRRNSTGEARRLSSVSALSEVEAPQETSQEVTASSMTGELHAVLSGCPFDFRAKCEEAFRRSMGATVTVRREACGPRTNMLVTIKEQHTTRQMRGSWGGG